jgi:hypothetical protein
MTMTEADWNAGNNPLILLDFLHKAGQANERKLRLFVVACCRRLWSHLLAPRVREAVETVERVADGLVEKVELSSTARIISRGDHEVARVAVNADPLHAARRTVERAAFHAGVYSSWEGESHEEGTSREATAQSRLLRDLFGNPFQPLPPMKEAWLTWNGGAVRRLAEAAYEHRMLPSGDLEPDRLAVLADALEEAGVTDADLLGHLRGPGPHYRGCFAVDWLLGKS